MGFDIADLEKRLARLPPFYRVAFAAACSERLLPNYAAFSRSESWGDVKTLRAALDEAWGAVEKQRADPRRTRELINECERVIPDTEDFDSPLVSAALDAGSAVVETLKCCLDGEPRRAAEVASFARDTVDMFTRERDDMDYSDPEFENKIARDPLMCRELRRQKDDLELLRKTPRLSREFLESLKGKNSESNIGLR